MQILFPRKTFWLASLAVGALGGIAWAGVFQRISLEDFLKQHGGRAFEGVLSEKRFLPGSEEGTYFTLFTLTGRSLHDGRPAQVQVRVPGGTGADANIYSTSITPENLREKDTVLAYLRPLRDGTWALDGFPYVNAVVVKPGGKVVIGDENSMFVRTIRPLDGTGGVRDEVVQTAQRLGIK